MAYEQKKEYPQENSGVLFLKDAHDGNPRFPTHSGSFTDITGKKWRLVAWSKVSGEGQEFLSLSASEFKENGTPKPEGFKPTPTLPKVYEPKKYAPMKSALEADADIGF
jgi:hypothetical protein